MNIVITRRTMLVLLACVALLVLVGCSEQSYIAEMKKPSTPMNVICNTAYRSSVAQQIEERASVTLTQQNSEAELPYKDLVFHALYFYGTPHDIRSLVIFVTPPGSNDRIFNALYQMSRTEKLANQFFDHGFTGLNYVYHPTSKAELQYWCTTE